MEMYENADYICEIIAHNLKAFREKQKLSMDQLAALSGVSKSMIGQIERAETNTSVSTLWKIASGLRVPFTSLIEHNQESNVMLVEKKSVDVVKSEDNLFRVYPYFPANDGRNFEILYIEMDPGASSRSEPHAEGTEEYLFVFGSKVDLFVGPQKYEILPGNAITFVADQPHMYYNDTDQPATVIDVILYKRG